jgi:hypothetical protein
VSYTEIYFMYKYFNVCIINISDMKYYEAMHQILIIQIYLIQIYRQILI